MPRGFNSLAVEAHHQPQASLAWRAAMTVVKRRQQVLKPCDGAPKLFCRWSLGRIGCGGSTRIYLGCCGATMLGLVQIEVTDFHFLAQILRFTQDDLLEEWLSC